MNAPREETVFYGIGVSPGMVLGQALKLDIRNRAVIRLHMGSDRVEEEVGRVQQAIQASKEQLELLKSRLAEKVGPEHSFILDVHRLMLEDTDLISQIVSIIRQMHTNAEWAVRQATDRIRDAYAFLDDEYFRDRSCDIENVVERILFNLSGDKPISWATLPKDLIIVSHYFNPASFAIMDLDKVRGLALESGGRTSHTAIISRSLRLPAIMGICDSLSSITSGDVLLLDGDEGQLIVNPTTERLDRVRGRLEEFIAMGEAAPAPAGAAILSLGGTPISLRANTDLPHEVRTAKKCGAEGIGLFRSEFLFLGYPRGLPNMDAQLDAYRMLAQEMNPHPVAIRTLDTGNDKVLAGTGAAATTNASMGLRGIRLSLIDKKMFCTQIEAILRATRFGRMEIILPMVTTVEEIWEAKALIQAVACDIWGSSGSAGGSAPIGAMIEVPGAVLALESIAKHVDFLCVGTNDLIQYVLAVDRGNPQVSHLFQPLHPSILFCLRHIAKVGSDLNKPVRICGEMSSNPFFVVLLLGMGYSEFSMTAFSIPTIRRVLQMIDLHEARTIAQEALTLASAREIGEYLVDCVARMVRIDLSPYVREVRTPNGRAALACAP